MVRIEVVGLDGMIKEMQRLQRELSPSAATVARLDAALAQTFARTQADVHVHTGALKASGRVSSEVDRHAHRWEGTITYGSETDPAAWYEVARGQDHDFMRSTRDELTDELFRDAMLDAFKERE